MDQAVVVALIASAPASVAAVAAMRANRKAESTHGLVEKIEISINSRMSALLEQTAEAARLAGMAAERQVGASRAADVATATALIAANTAASEQRAAEARMPENEGGS